MEPRGGVPKASLPGFVSTSILTSSDGLFGDNAEEKRVTEAPASQLEAIGVYKPLYEQLQERKETKDLEWKEKNNPFAPPKGLDEEEFEYFQDLESKKQDIKRKRQAQHEEYLAFFGATISQFGLRIFPDLTHLFHGTVAARGTPKPASAVMFTAQHLQKYHDKGDVKTTIDSETPILVLKAKRKAENVTADSSAAESLTFINKKLKEVNSGKLLEKPKLSTAALGLGDYGSGSDSDDADDKQ